VSNTNASEDPAERAATTSLGDLFSEVTRDLSTLIRQEVDLAKAELKESATSAGKGAGLLGGAGVAAHFALLFLSIGAWWALGTVTGGGWSGVVVAVVYAIVALVLYTRGRKQLAQVKGLPQTAQSVKKIPEALKPEETR
jgi:hypothetical protein